jgi:adenine-specific DNA-methyltransferase
MANKLELNWAGKHDGYALIRDEATGKPVPVPYDEVQPRLLVEAGRYGDELTDNILISGENLYALKTLAKSGYAGKIKCIYIDPPFNTGEAFQHYDDALEHSLWLTMMRDRIRLLHELLSDTGSMFIHIDDNELAYLIALTDEIFDRKNRISVITFKQSSASGPKAINPGLVTTSNFILYYAKNKSKWEPYRVFILTVRDARYGSYISNYDDNFSKWRLEPLRGAFASSVGITVKELKDHFGDALEAQLEEFVLQAPERVVQLARVTPKDINAEARIELEKSAKKSGVVYRAKRKDKDDYYFLNGKQVLFYSSKVREIDGRNTTGEAATTIWADLLSNNVHNEGGVHFPNGKKPELLIKRILELSTRPCDTILDCFAGSGTTGAVALKMNRRFIMVEAGNHCETHIVPRLRKVIDGTDTGGISPLVPPHPSRATTNTNLIGESKPQRGWTGGGGFRSYTLGKSLIEKDAQTGVWRLNYTNGRLIEAVCLQEGFKLLGHGNYHGVRGRHYAHIADCIVTQEYVGALASELAEDESLTLYCIKSKRKLTMPDSVQLKRIPRDLLQPAPGKSAPHAEVMTV